jgi:hypothetical protein
MGARAATDSTPPPPRDSDLGAAVLGPPEIFNVVNPYKNSSWAQITLLGVGIARAGTNNTFRTIRWINASTIPLVNLLYAEFMNVLDPAGLAMGRKVILAPPCIFYFG